ncbi:AAA family ATPase [Budviciaceae bacterium BWR-B9]|uniref:AAA family ATPase n=1 Tax=Limnobaculum allomyrinae TaxID=2791986 RepID=A0ABS1IWS1_9GAMM|nr:MULTISPECIES: AAA family ATPase [Limnobaculum]MBK5145966.1 AAA family ATPase [Limnobaculum allomyrinae]MBV7693979.1 AAA family ATPase [Limnobaculum sp. M2-1]
MALILKQVINRLGLSQTQLARSIKYKGNSLSNATVNLIVNYNQWPRSIDEELIKKQIEDTLLAQGLQEEFLVDLFEETGAKNILADNSAPVDPKSEKKESTRMLLRKHTLSRATRAHFRLPRDPFTDEMQSDNDVFLSDEIRYVREAMRQIAKHGGMLAVIGESGAGKSTLRQDLIEWINVNHEPITVIEPYVLGMEDNEVKGKALKSVDISGAIINAIDPHAKPRRSAEARARQMHDLLKSSAQTGRKHVLIVEEAHGLPIPTLKHLKRFYELQEGFKKLLSIILIGQTELQYKLSEHNPEVREVVQRTEIVHLKPLDAKVEDYIHHKFKCVGIDYSDLFESSAFDEILNRLRISVTEGHGASRGVKVRSLCYPLAVNNLVTGALNLAHRIGAQKVTGEVVAESVKEREEY